uniref:Uncharacterized protein n=1 Tax=Candidatus Kentrum sp. LPFa TaxID=2126335 RepID=A0A450WJY0_9GAMM|nr:MAG: hypothetical protein BECKLPF1236B_GA0070989_11154 [Candidatus Kentron sp. LPFa]
MNNYYAVCANRLMEEIKTTPEEYLPALLHTVRIFREGITLKPAESSFRQGWKEAMSGETIPVEELWIGVGDGE